MLLCNTFGEEDEYGNRVDSSTDEIYEALTSRLPPLIFLSGCRTAYSSEETIPSMAEAFVKLIFGTNFYENIGFFLTQYLALTECH